jgi:hypothetical protein
MDEEPKAKQPAAVAQEPAPQFSTPKAGPAPYARVGEDGVSYAGPHLKDVPPGPVRAVLFGPQAAEVAQLPEVKADLEAEAASGREWKLLPVGSDPSWRAGDWQVWAATDQLVHAIMDEHPLAIVALNSDAAHLAEQLSLKAFVPVIALSNDKKLTSTNVPWIFRLPPQTTPAAALRLLEMAAAQSGANPEKLRAVLASGNKVSGVAFLSTGEPRGQ